MVTSAVLGGVPYTVHTTTSDGRDSTYEAMLTGANYPLSIDHIGGRIYLQDSLPAGSDVSRMTFASFTYQGSAIAIRSLTTATDTIFNLNDSTDCSLPRLITVYGADGSQRTYTLELRVHKQVGDEMNWTRLATQPQVAALQKQKLLVSGGVLYLFGQSESDTELLTSTDKGLTWERTTITPDLRPRSVTLVDDTFFALDGIGNLFTSPDGAAWTPVDGRMFTTLAGGAGRLFGVAEDMLWSSADGVSWTADELSETAPLPAKEWSGIAIASATNVGFSDLILVGLAADGTPAPWHRTIDLSGRYTFPWNSFVGITVDYPILRSTSLTAYDGAPLLAGLNADGTLAGLYISRDKGKTWLSSEIIAPDVLPATSVSIASDEENNLFVLLGGSGEVWCGKLARLNWNAVQHDFYR